MAIDLFSLLSDIMRDRAVVRDPLAPQLAIIATSPTGITRAGHPYLSDTAYAIFRDRVPHVLAMGPVALTALDIVVAAADRVPGGRLAIEPAVKVVRSCILTAAITAPADLWLLRHVLGVFTRVGLIARIFAGERIDPLHCEIDIDGRRLPADPRELDADLTFLASRGLVDVEDGVFTAPPHPRAQLTLRTLGAAPPWPADLSRTWLTGFEGRATADERAILQAVAASAHARTDVEQSTWIPTAAEIEGGFRLVPVVLALRAAGLHAVLVDRDRVTAADLGADNALAACALAVLTATGVVDADGVVTPTGKRVAEKGAGPMGIIEAYHPYMAKLDEILVHGRRGGAWVTRGANIAASQDANRDSFTKANDSLDAFCADTGFTYGVFIEHAIGRGEATRQRFGRSGDNVRYFGADLEDAAIDACLEEQRRGHLPAEMIFVRHADIGEPATLIAAIREAGASTEGAVMVVGNGFHEVRGQTDAKMVDVFKAYCDAGILLLFTEENALRVDDLLATAWNTYHAGFRYVHEKSGQGLRPAEPTPPSRIGRELQKSWRECAELAGYVRTDPYSSRSRTVYPLAPRTGSNPTISANHFCVPKRIVETLERAGGLR